MSDEVFYTFAFGIMIVPGTLLGVTMPQERSKIPPLVSAVALAIMVCLTVLYALKQIPREATLYGEIAMVVVTLAVGIPFIAKGKSSSKVYTKEQSHIEEWAHYQLFREQIINLRTATDIASVFDEIQKHTFIFNSDYMLEKFRLFRLAIEECHKFYMNKSPIIDDMLQQTNKWMHKKYKRRLQG